MDKKRKQGLLGPVPYGKTVVFRKGKPIFISKAIIAWRKRNRRRAKVERAKQARLARYNEVYEESMAALGARIVNPFAPDEE
jgi:hypothetical protein